MIDLHLAVFGTKQIPRAFCTDCERYSLILDSKIQCCDSSVTLDVSQIKQYKRMSLGTPRKYLAKKTKDSIIENQQFCCFYCGHYFDIVVRYNNKLVTLVPHFDHIVPFSYDQNNNVSNLIAACNLCNLWKSNRIFSNLEDIQIYVKEKYKKEITITDEVTVRILRG